MRGTPIAALIDKHRQEAGLLMDVSVNMHGVLGRTSPGEAASFNLALHEGATAGELIRLLAKRCGAPFSDAVDSSDSRLPRHIRMFSDGKMLLTFEQPLVAACAQAARVNIVVLTPMMGG